MYLKNKKNVINILYKYHTYSFVKYFFESHHILSNTNVIKNMYIYILLFILVFIELLKFNKLTIFFLRKPYQSFIKTTN